MPLTLDEYKGKLVNKLLYASGQDEVKYFIGAGVEGLIDSHVDKRIVIDFIDALILELESFYTMNKKSRQWSNIKKACMYLNGLKRQINETQKSNR